MSHYGDIEVYFQVLLFIYILRFFSKVCVLQDSVSFFCIIFIFLITLCVILLQVCDTRKHSISYFLQYLQ